MSETEKVVDFTKTVHALCTQDPEIANILAQIGFTDILKPGMLNTAGRFMTVPKGAALKKISMPDIEAAFSRHGYKIIGGEKHE